MFTHSLGLLLLALLPLAIDCYKYGPLPIRRGSVLTSWQSSFGNGHTCFYNRSEADETSVLSDPYSSFRFFHSAGKHEADDGFHWFAVQLNEPLPIRSVTVKGREDNQLWMYNSINGIEIWTSSSSSQLFSGDHCHSRNMSQQFNESRHAWRLCGVINRAFLGIRSAEEIPVPCACENRGIQFILLRKNVSSKTVRYYFDGEDVMSFSDLMLETASEHSSCDSADLPAWNSSISVLGSANCVSLSDAVILFNSSVPQGEAEHMCTADAGGGRVMDLTLISMSSSIATGSVSAWKLDTHVDRRRDWPAGTIECRAGQSLHSSEILSSATASWSCKVERGWSFITPFALGFSAAAVSVGILIAVLVGLGVIKCAIRWADWTRGAAGPGGREPDRFLLASDSIRAESQPGPAEQLAPDNESITPSADSRSERHLLA